MRSRRRVHLTLTAAAIGCCIAAAALAAHPAQPGQAPDGRARVATSPPTGTEPPNRPSGADLRAKASRVARRFLRAFLLFQAGRLNATTRQELRDTSTPALAGSLLARPPRLDRSHSRWGRLERLTVVGPYLTRLKIVARVVYPELGPSLLEAGIHRRGRSVRIARLYP